MRIIIAAGGKAERWKNYRNTPKHLLKIEGEVLLERTIRQFKKYTDDIIIISHDDYIFEGTRLEKPLEGDWYDFGKLYSSHHLWSDDKTFIIYGDVYFTDEAVEKIMTSDGEYKFFLRLSASKVTHKKYGEIFGITFSGNMKDKIKKNIEELIEKKERGVGTWQLYYYMHKIFNHNTGSPGNTAQLKKTIEMGGYIEIDDWTDDFDVPEDLLNWESNRLAI
jgi:CTP:phosphocholine cytidylyltransferase-like protein